MGRPIYVDLDDTLITSELNRRGEIKRIIPRPDAADFIQALSRHGDLFLLTHAMRSHVQDAFVALGPVVELFRGVISREDMEPIIEQVDYLYGDHRLSDHERSMLYREIQPLAPRGFIFDDQPVGSSLYLIKMAVIGGRAGDWIQVKSFGKNLDDHKALSAAYRDYLRRSVGSGSVIMSGRRRSRRDTQTVGA